MRQNISKNIELTMMLISVLFVIKALYMAFYITPLWSIPDEIGHLASTYSIATGNGIPLLGKAKISTEIMSSFTGVEGAPPVKNWIAQHPPIYYIIAAIPLKIGMYFTDNTEILFRLPRIISALAGGLLLFVLYKTMIMAKVDEYRSLLLASAVGFIPMFSHLSSGVNHDSMIFLFCAIVAYYFTKYLMHKNIKDIYLMALWLTLGAGIKMTVWVIIPPLLLFVVIYLFFNTKHKYRHIFGVSLLTLAVPIGWMIRNYYYFNNIFYTASSDGSFGKLKDNPLTDTFLEYLHTQPVIEHFLMNFYGLLGWHNYTISGNAWFQVASTPRTSFVWFMTFISFALTLFIIIKLYGIFRINSNKTILSFEAFPCINMISNKYLKLSLIAMVLASSLISGLILYKSIVVVNVFFIISTSLLLWSAMMASMLIFFSQDKRDIIFYLFLIIFFFFTVILLHSLYEIYLLDGRMRATHGRYFYPVIPFILLSIAIALDKLKFPNILLAAIVVWLAIMEMQSFVIQAIPFYWSFK